MLDAVKVSNIISLNLFLGMSLFGSEMNTNFREYYLCQLVHEKFQPLYHVFFIDFGNTFFGDTKYFCDHVNETFKGKFCKHK